MDVLSRPKALESHELDYDKGSFEQKVMSELAWLKREAADTATYAHKAMWYSAIAMCAGILLFLRAGGFI